MLFYNAWRVINTRFYCYIRALSFYRSNSLIDKRNFFVFTFLCSLGNMHGVHFAQRFFRCRRVAGTFDWLVAKWGFRTYTKCDSFSWTSKNHSFARLTGCEVFLGRTFDWLVAKRISASNNKGCRTYIELDSRHVLAFWIRVTKGSCCLNKYHVKNLIKRKN